MRFISYTRNGTPGFGIVREDGIVDLTGRHGAASLADLLGKGLQGAAMAEAAGRKADFALQDVSLEPVIPNPSKIICVGINYVAHAEEAGRKVGKYPVIFHRFADTLVAHGKPLVRSKVSNDFDFEGELAVVIGKGGRHIAREDAMAHVAGYTGFNDSTFRDWQFHTHQYGMGKNFAGTGALGPWMVSVDEVPDYRQMELRTRLNGQQVQEGKLDQLAFDIPFIIAYVSQALPWRPGDIIATGTPSGVGFKREPPLFMKPGDTVTVEITGIGVLENPIVAE